MNAFLDSPIIDLDPSKGRDRDDPMRAFKDLFEADPEQATILYISGYFAGLLIVAQQGVRIYKHCFFSPDKMCPWEVVCKDAVCQQLGDSNMSDVLGMGL